MFQYLAKRLRVYQVIWKLLLHFTADLLHCLNQIESGNLLHIIIRKLISSANRLGDLETSTSPLGTLICNDICQCYIQKGGCPWIPLPPFLDFLPYYTTFPPQQHQASYQAMSTNNNILHITGL